MASQGTTGFEIATWYDTWNQLGLDNLASGNVPLGYATRYNLAFGQLTASAPRPQGRPTNRYGNEAVQAFNDNVDVVELQDYSSTSTPVDAPVWTSAGVNAGILMGGVCTENSGVQTSLPDTQSWTQWAMQNGLKGMFSWRLDNDHGTHGTDEDVDPTFTGAKTVYDTVTGA